ncbi:MFS transporter [Amphibacillus indicireducens]|uniref:MFS transporter n=1 Tax=Amphibacillus indicireducens TaxID=1076330 RepID=A0ABP7V722_9BACI
MKSKKLDLFALASIPLVMTLGNSMLIPVLPVIETELNISQLQSSLIITIYSIVAILLIPIAGYLSDRFGRKKVIIPSLIITVIGGGVAAFAGWRVEEPYLWLMIGRFIQGIGAAGAFPVVIPTVSDMYQAEEDVSKGLGIIETSNTFGKVLSPIIGAALALIVWYMPFIFVPIFSLISIVLVLLLVKVPKQRQVNKPTFSSSMKKIKATFKKNGRWLVAIFLIGGLNMFILFGYQFHFSNLLENQYQINGVAKGFMLAIPLLILCVASYLSSKKIKDDKVLMKWLIFSGNLIIGVPLLFINQETGLVLITILLSISSLGIGVSLPSLDTLITEGVKKNVRGTVTSFYRFSERESPSSIDMG